MARTKKIEQGELLEERKKLSTEQRKYINNRVKELAGGVAIKIVSLRKRMKIKFCGNLNQLYSDQMPEIEKFLSELAAKEQSKNDKAQSLGNEFINKQAQRFNKQEEMKAVQGKADKKCNAVEEKEFFPIYNNYDADEVSLYIRLEEIGQVLTELQHKKIIDIKLKTLDKILSELEKIKEKI